MSRPKRHLRRCRLKLHPRTLREQLESRWYAAFMAELAAEPGSEERARLGLRARRLSAMLRTLKAREVAA